MKAYKSFGSASATFVLHTESEVCELLTKAYDRAGLNGMSEVLAAQADLSFICVKVARNGVTHWHIGGGPCLSMTRFVEQDMANAIPL